MPDIELGKKVFNNITSTEKKAIAIFPTMGAIIVCFRKSNLGIGHGGMALRKGKIIEAAGVQRS
ncbi:hypothetical protein, partial [Nostoc sp. JL34]